MRTRRPIARRVSVPLFDTANDVLDELSSRLMCGGRAGYASQSAAARWLIEQIVHEGLYAMADRLDSTGEFNFIIRLECADGNRRGMAREEEAAQIDAVLQEASK